MHTEKLKLKYKPEGCDYYTELKKAYKVHELKKKTSVIGEVQAKEYGTIDFKKCKCGYSFLKGIPKPHSDPNIVECNAVTKQDDL